MTAALKAITGSAGAPSITFTSDATTGLYLISAGNLGLTSSGVLALTINSAQVGVFVTKCGVKQIVHAVLDNADATTSSNITTLATTGTGAIAVGSTTNWKYQRVISYWPEMKSCPTR